MPWRCHLPTPRAGYARSALDRDQRGETGVEVLLKPFRVDELAEKIREMLG